jgi:hypothetical protein
MCFALAPNMVPASIEGCGDFVANKCSSIRFKAGVPQSPNPKGKRAFTAM